MKREVWLEVAACLLAVESVGVDSPQALHQRPCHRHAHVLGGDRVVAAVEAVAAVGMVPAVGGWLVVLADVGIPRAVCELRPHVQHAQCVEVVMVVEIVVAFVLGPDLLCPVLGPVNAFFHHHLNRPAPNDGGTG